MTPGNDVFGLGQCSLDYLGQISAYPPPDEKCEMTNLTIQGGGPAATALVALARWGWRCRLAGVIGDDEAGRKIMAELAQEGINTEGIIVRPGHQSQQAFILADPATAQRTIFWQRPTGKPLDPGEVDLQALRCSRVLHTDAQPIETALYAAKKARSWGIPVVADLGSLRPGLLELVRWCDYCIVAETFARDLTGEDNPLKTCLELHNLGPRLVAVTLGARGYAFGQGGEFHVRPAYPVTAVDTTGCGDVFHAGFIHGLLSGLADEESLDVGAWAASRVALAMGGRAGIPSRGELADEEQRQGRKGKAF
jgi:ribokinase